MQIYPVVSFQAHSEVLYVSGPALYLMYVHGILGAALGPLLAGLLSSSGWNNVFYMLMIADACALVVSHTIP